MSQDSQGARVRLRDEHVVWKQMGDEGVVLDLRSSTYLSLNETGAFLFPLLERGATELQLVEELAREYDLGESRATADVRAFLEALGQRGLTTSLGDPA